VGRGALSAARGPVRVASAWFWDDPPDRRGQPGRDWEDIRRWQRSELAQHVARHVRGRGAVTLVYPGGVAWFERGWWVPESVDRASLLTRGGGYVEWVRHTGIRPDGRAALRAACRTGMLGPGLTSAAGRIGELLRVGDVRRTFEALFPDGFVYTAGEPVPPRLDRLVAADKRRVLAEAAAFARDFAPNARTSDLDVSCLCVEGKLRLIFVAGGAQSRSSLAGWQPLIRQLNVRAALSDVVDA
jgi:hypothetical protein